MTLQQRIRPHAAPPAGRAEPEIAELAHDLRNMMTSALLHLERLQGAVAPSGRGGVDKSIAAIERARAILQQAVDATDDQATPVLTGFDLPDLVGAVAAELSVPGAVEIDVAIAAGLDRRIVSCPARVGRILHNLLVNAVAATGATGRIAVAVASPARDRVEIRVSDHGPGLPAEVRARLGDRRLPSRTGGGLGLAAALRMADRLGGSLVVADSGPTGTAMLLTLPAVAARAGR